MVNVNPINNADGFEPKSRDFRSYADIEDMRRAQLTYRRVVEICNVFPAQ